ncbi:N terminus of Rad21 / Rec8 like family protein [Brugia pahangi]
MFFIPSILMKRNEPLSVIWRIVFDEKWRPPRKIILEINIERACELLIGKIPNGNPGEIKFSLYLLAQLSYGIALIVQKRGDILCRDMETFIPIIRRYQYENEDESTMKGKKDRKKRVPKRNDFLILDSSFETIESEHLKIVLDYSAITLHEDIPLPEIDTLFNDDFGPLTEAEAQQMEALLKDDSEHIERKSKSINESKEIVNIIPETLANEADVNKATHEAFEMMEVSDENEIRKERQYDLTSDEALQEPEIKHPPCLSILELSDVHDSQIIIPKKKRRKNGIIIDELTMFNKAQLQAQIDCIDDLLHTRDEMIPQISKRGAVTVQDLFDVRPMTLREFAKNPMSNLDAWISAPEYDEPPLQYKDAMQLEPMQAPPMRTLHHFSDGRETLTDSTSHESVKINLQDLERQTVTPMMEDIEQGRRNTTSTAPFGSTRTTTDPSSQLRSDGGLPVASSENRLADEKMKISVATIFERTAEEERIDDSFTLLAEKPRVTDLFSNLTIESELRGTKLESSTENILVDERYSECEIRQEEYQNEQNIPKISVMQDRFQLKVSKRKSTLETGDSSLPNYYQTQSAHDLFGLITEFLNSHEASSLCFSELIRGHTAVFAAKAFTNLLELLAKQKVKVEQEENFAEIVIRLQ